MKFSLSGASGIAIALLLSLHSPSLQAALPSLGRCLATLLSESEKNELEQIDRELDALRAKGLANAVHEAVDGEYLKFVRKHKARLDWASRLMLGEMLDRSKSFQAKLLASPRSRELRTFDVIFLGAGIHTGIVKSVFVRNLAIDPKKVKMLTIEGGSDISVMGKLAGTFQGNTLEHADIATNLSLTPEQLKEVSRNFQPGSPVQTYQIAGGPVPNSGEFAFPAIASHFQAGGEYHFGKRGTSVTPFIGPNGEALERVVLENGETFYARHVISGFGTGKQLAPTRDPESLEFLKTAIGKERVEDAEDYLARKRDQPKPGEHAKEVIVGAGGGHGTAIVFEMALNMAPGKYQVPGLDPALLPGPIHWVGLDAANGTQFKETIGGGTRYFALAPLIDDGRIIPHPYYIHQILPGRQKPLRVSLMDKVTRQVVQKDGQTVWIEADRVLNAVGYKNETSDVFHEYTPEVIKGRINPTDKRLTSDRDVNIGLQMVDKDARPRNVLIVGPAAGKIAEEKDPGGSSSVVINIFAPRSEAVGKKLAEQFKP